MFSRADALNAGGGNEYTSYPTQWALNPSAYSGVDASAVDWAALAQQWIQMKDATPVAPIAIAPPAPLVPSPVEDTSDAMELEEPDAPPAPNLPAAQWAGVNTSTSSTWSGSPGWNQWGWGWSGAGESKSDTMTSVSHMNYAANEPPVSGYATASLAAPTYQSGYWTAHVDSQASVPEVPIRKSYETKGSSRNRRNRERLPHMPPLAAPGPTPLASTAPTLDAAKRKQLPAWIREGLEKMEREKARAAERAAEDAALIAAERERKEAEEREMERIRAEGGLLPAKSKFDSDSETKAGFDGDEKRGAEEEVAREEEVSPVQGSTVRSDPVVQRSKEEILQEIMLTVRRTLTEILLEVTDHEIHTVSQEELARYNAAQASSLNAVGKSKALSAITSGLGLAEYGSSDSESDNDDQLDGVTDITDLQLQEIIRKRRQEFERTSREIEAELRAAEEQEAEGATEASAQVNTSNGEKTNHSSTPDLRQRAHSRHSTTPPPIDRDQFSKHAASSQRRHSIDSMDSNRKVNKKNKKILETIHEKPKRSGKEDRTPSPVEERRHTPNKRSVSSSSLDSEDSESSSNSSSESSKSRNSTLPKKIKRESSTDSSNDRKASKKYKRDKKQSKNSISQDRDGKYSKPDKDDGRSHSKHKSEYKEKGSKSSRRNYDEKSSKYDKESKLKRKAEDEYYERSHRYEKACRKEDNEYQRHDKDYGRRHKQSESRDYDKSKYREDEDRHRRHKRSHSTSYSDKRDKRSRSREHSEDRYKWEERSRRRERRRSRDKSYDRYSSRAGREQGGHRGEERRSRSRSRDYRR